MKIRALVVRAPWAQLIASGRKRFEIRSRQTTHRGPLVIVAGLKIGDGCGDAIMTGLLTEPELQAALEGPRGIALCVVDVVDCKRVTDFPSIRDVRAGACVAVKAQHWAWVLENPRAVPGSPPVRGQQGLFWVDLPGCAA